MTLATCSGARGPLLSQSWSKSKGGMFEILHLLFWKNVRRHGKNWSNTIKYTWKSSSGSELYRGISVFIPRRQENIKKQYRNKVEKWRVSEARPLILPSCTTFLIGSTDIRKCPLWCWFSYHPSFQPTVHPIFTPLAWKFNFWPFLAIFHHLSLLMGGPLIPNPLLLT